MKRRSSLSSLPPSKFLRQGPDVFFGYALAAGLVTMRVWEEPNYFDDWCGLGVPKDLRPQLGEYLAFPSPNIGRYEVDDYRKLLPSELKSFQLNGYILFNKARERKERTLWEAHQHNPPSIEVGWARKDDPLSKLCFSYPCDNSAMIACFHLELWAFNLRIQISYHEFSRVLMFTRFRAGTWENIKAKSGTRILTRYGDSDDCVWWKLWSNHSADNIEIQVVEQNVVSLKL